MFTILHDDPTKSITERLFLIRNIEDALEDFLRPTIKRYRTPRQLFGDAEKAANRVWQAMQNKEKIMIFGDYDVDGIMSTFVLYTFLREHMGCETVSLRLPHRVQDGYGIKKHHIDLIHEAGCTLIITVDNGITAIEEVTYAKGLGIDVIVTDHHQPGTNIPDAFALINPQTTPNHPFKEVCGAVVASKFCLAVADRAGRSKQQKYDRLVKHMPYLAFATIADCMPLVGENRCIVKTGLELINNHRQTLHLPLQRFLEYLNLGQIDAFHVGFVIAPRLNATGRVGHALDGLKALLTKDPVQQRVYLEHMDTLNTERKKIQEGMIEETDAQIDHEQPLLRAASPEFHEGIVGIVAGRITEKRQKPSLIMGINEQEGIAMGSLRGPDWFNVVGMLRSADHILLRYGGHAQAGGLTVALDRIDELIACLIEHCNGLDIPENTEIGVIVDTPIYTQEMNRETLASLTTFGPYGEGNREPLLIIQDATITQASTVGKTGNGHLKLHSQKENTPFTAMHRGKGDTVNTIATNTPTHVIGRVKEDTFNGGWYLDVKSIIVSD